MNRRWINFVPFLIWCYLIFYLFNLQILKHHRYSIRAKDQHEVKVKLIAQRGNIYDRDGMPIAVSVKAYSIYAVTKYIDDINSTSLKLAKAGLGSYRSLKKSLKRNQFIWLKNKADEKLANRVKKLGLAGIGVIEDYKRVYPQEDYLSDLVGVVSRDNRGLSGIEYQLDSILSGEDGFAIFQKKPGGKRYPYPHYPMLEPQKGANVYLTIDLDIQILLYQTLRRGMNRYKAKRAMGLVIEPSTGKILAMVNINGKKNHNSVIGDEFEPGSTFKVVTLGSALASECNFDKKIDVRGGRMKVGKHYIHDFRDYGILSLEDVFVHSSNVGAVKIGKKIKADIFFQIARSLGFGNLTGINLPNEAKGKIYLPKEMREIRYANNCFGQGLTVTLLQLTNSYAAIAAGGKLYRPYVIKKLEAKDNCYIQKPFMIREALPAWICEKMQNVLAKVVDEGTGKRAKSKRIDICGKTGTAQKAGEGGYLADKILTSFIGFFPAQEPKYVVGIMLDEPELGNWASQITAPVFGEVVDGLLKMPGLIGDYYACSE